ncbi:MAG: PKD domain-containing protein [Deltaproteobacteria bacterium]|nr:PKD domain-containing protein [Deltaproteobacteria bacterium]
MKFSVVVIGLASFSACNPPEDDLVRGNTPPVAALRAPVIAPQGMPVRFDASASQDDDGDLLTFVFQWNDGTEATRASESAATHVFGREILVTVVVHAIDIHGAEALAEQDVSIRLDYPSPPDFCDAGRPCVVGDECDAGVCYANGGSVE